jgi:hypothetical protein
MKKSARNSLVAGGIGLVAVSSILIAKRRRGAGETEMSEEIDTMVAPLQGGAGDEDYRRMATDKIDKAEQQMDKVEQQLDE